MASREGRKGGMRGSRIIDLARGILSDYILDSYACRFICNFVGSIESECRINNKNIEIDAFITNISDCQI